MLRVYVVDDEPAAREMLAYYLEQEEGISLLGMSGKPLEAIEEINARKPDLVFLDIKMPQLSGMEMVPYLKHKPMIVFCTAYDEYAVEAFRVKALDYLLKPISKERVHAVLKRSRLEWDKLVALKLSSVSQQGLRRIVCPRGRHYDIVWLRDVLCFYKAENYVRIVDTNGSEHFTELSINYIDEQNDMPDLFRINRAQIIRRSIVKAYLSGIGGGLELETIFDKDPKLSANHAEALPFVVSRRRATEFRKWLKQS